LHHPLISISSPICNLPAGSSCRPALHFNQQPRAGAISGHHTYRLLVSTRPMSSRPCACPPTPPTAGLGNLIRPAHASRHVTAGTGHCNRQPGPETAAHCLIPGAEEYLNQHSLSCSMLLPSSTPGNDGNCHRRRHCMQRAARSMSGPAPLDAVWLYVWLMQLSAHWASHRPRGGLMYMADVLLRFPTVPSHFASWQLSSVQSACPMLACSIIACSLCATGGASASTAPCRSVSLHHGTPGPLLTTTSAATPLTSHQDSGPTPLQR
jgi:hypothetical protein